MRREGRLALTGSLSCDLGRAGRAGHGSCAQHIYIYIYIYVYMYREREHIVYYNII